MKLFKVSGVTLGFMYEYKKTYEDGSVWLHAKVIRPKLLKWLQYRRVERAVEAHTKQSFI